MLALTALLSAQAHAGVTLDGGYQYQLEKDFDLPGHGYSAGASVDLGRHFYLGAGYSSVRTDPFETGDARTGRYEYRSVSGSLGGFLPLSDAVGVSASAGYSVSRTYGLEDLSEEPVEQTEGVTGSVALHLAAPPRLDFSVGYGSSFIGGERSGDGSVGVSVLTVPNVWIEGSYWVASESEGWTAGLRARFGE